MKNLIRGLDIPLYITLGMILASLVIRKNIITEDLTAYIVCMLISWGVGWLRQYVVSKKKAEEAKTEGNQHNS